MTNANNDSDDLEALFDSIASENKEAAAPAAEPAAKKAPAKKAAAKTEEAAHNDEVINKIGHMTRALHDSLRELGYDKNLENECHSGCA